MTPKLLARIKDRIRACRRGAGNLRHRDLASIATALGRRRSKQRTTEPTYESDVFKEANVITIPDHSKGLKKWTALSILDQLEEDVFRWETRIKREQKERARGNGYENGEDEDYED